jgi:hypothetical protein
MLFLGRNCLALQESVLGFGSELVPYCSSMLSPSMLLPLFPSSVGNRDLA